MTITTGAALMSMWMADALTSVLAILALLTGRYLGWSAVDPLMGLVGAGLIMYWAAGLVATRLGSCSMCCRRPTRRRPSGERWRPPTTFASRTFISGP